MKLTVVIPVFNEQETIQQIVAKVQDVPVDKEIVLVDDCSTDSSPGLLKDLEASASNIRVLSQPVNQGKGAALRAGFAAARGDLVIVQDADLEYDPGEYPKVLQPILDGQADVVYGSRFAHGRPSGDFLLRSYLANRFLTWLSNRFTGLRLTDMETCYKAFRRPIIQSVEIRENRFGFEPEITAKVARQRVRVREVPISYQGRSYEQGKKIGWRDGVRAIWCILKYNLWARGSAAPAPAPKA